MINGIAGVIIWTANLPRLRSFYTGVLGLKPFSSHDYSVSFVWGDLRLRIARHSSIKGKNADPLRVMVNLDVDDIHEVYKSMLGKGTAFIRPPEMEEWGGWVSTFSDPDGNVLQLMQLPK